ncbi:MAG: O-antigen ligase family protein [Ignavibacteriaceae bacterium]|nr:O-antigen ligase family protein [Ignavibacteriaceae bacterium]
MKQKKTNINIGLSILYGITFISPVMYSILFYEMDAVQKVFFYSASLLLFLFYLVKYNFDKYAEINKPLLFVMIFFPITFLTCFVNGSSSLLILKLSELIVPFSIFFQTGLLFLILGEEKFFKTVSYSVVIVSTAFSIIGILEVFQIKIIELPSAIPPGSTLGHRSFAAEYLLPALPFLLILNEYVPRERKIYILLSAVINISFVLFTRNRSGIIILAFVSILYILFILSTKEKSNRIKVLLPVIGVLFISFLISLIPVKGTERPDLQSTASTFFDSEFKSNVLRLSFWDASIQMIGENPLTGVGLYKWSGYYPRYNSDYFTDETVTHIHSIHAHNDFLELFSENGFLAPVIFLAIFILIAYTLIKRIRHNEKYFAFLLTFLITAAYSLVAFPSYKFASYFLAAVVAGTALIRINEIEKHSLRVKFNNLKWILLLLIIIGGSTSYIRLKSELHFGESIYLKERRQYPMMSERLEMISKIFYPFDASKQPVDYYRAIANIYLGRYQEALKNNLSAQELAPYNPIIMRNIASSYYSLNDFNRAIEQYKTVKKYFPNYISPQINLIDIFSETGQIEKAKSLFDELISKFPENPRLLNYKAKFNSE